MSQISATAPGKVIVAGEYAVLQGAPAICMAVNRRARISISNSEQPRHTITAPGFLATPLELASIDDCARELPLLAALWQLLPAAPRQYLNIELDSRAFRDRGQKFGIGSSAAVTVALAAALCRLAAGEVDALDLAMTAHRNLQGGSGSGADVACSSAGGVIEYRMPGAQRNFAAWPKTLEFVLFWSGRSADTAAQLQKLEQANVAASQSTLHAAAHDVACAWQGQDGSHILATLNDYTKVLRQFDADHALGIFGAGHAALMDAATDGVVYKPCGAGGGDLGIAVATDAAALAAFVDSARQRNFEPLDLSIESTGVEVEGSVS